MSTHGWEGVTRADLAKMGAQPAPAKPSKYRNVKVIVDGITFDSKREANHYQILKARERCGEIYSLQLQVRYPLYAPQFGAPQPTRTDVLAVVAEYVADFTYLENGRLHVVDAKGRRVSPYPLKKKWMELQYGIEIEEV